MEQQLLNFILLDAEFLGIELLDKGGFTELLLRFLSNCVVTYIIARYIYYPSSKRRDYFTTYIMLSVIVFFMCFLLSNVKLSVGFALGLFAIFGILRYRTDVIPIKDMSYLFVIIGISVINALANKKVSYAELGFTNLAVIAVTYGIEKIWLTKHEVRKLVFYDRIDLIRQENSELMIKDLRERTGLDIHRFEIERIDFLRDIARIYIYFYDNLNDTEKEQ